MEDFLKKVIEGSGIPAPESCLLSFNTNFINAINVEWFKKENHYEAIFYRDNLEHIALFDFAGDLMEYRQNLPVHYLPEHIRETAAGKGEIMSSVMRNKGNRLEYEIIVRNKELNRFLLTFSDNGNIVGENKL